MYKTSVGWRVGLMSPLLMALVGVFGLGIDLFAEEAPTYPPGKLGEIVRLGEQIVRQTDTHPLSKEFVGNRLKCTSCHLEGGRNPQAASFIGVATAYPAWSPREQKVITLEDRILNCFIRSQNGKRPDNGSDVSTAIATYITWLSAGESIKMNPQGPHGPRQIPEMVPFEVTPAVLAAGEKLYVARCADCHGKQGQGDAENPPVWGADSFNTGAGLSHNHQLAAWLKVAMPLGDPDLTTAQAQAIAAYVNSHERPVFKLEKSTAAPKEAKSSAR